MIKKLLTFQNVAIAVLIVLLWVQHSCNSSRNDVLRKEIIKADSLKKELDGQYAKLVNDYNTERDLKKQLKKDYEDAYELIRKNGEKILSLSRYIVTLENRPPEKVTVTVLVRDSSEVEINDYYPDSNKFFIHHRSLYNCKKLEAITSWDFRTLKIDAVLTETEGGLWNARLIGPDWFAVNDIKVNSLPAKEYNSESRKFLRGFLGLGVNYQTTDKAFGIQLNGGIDINDKWILDSYINTHSTVGVGLNKKF